MTDMIEAAAKAAHIAYEAEAINVGWSTQESCRVPYDDLPAANKACMIAAIEEARPYIIAEYNERLMGDTVTKEAGTAMVYAARQGLDGFDAHASVAIKAAIRKAGE